jgi:hypothetical protein
MYIQSEVTTHQVVIIYYIINLSVIAHLLKIFSE